MEMLKYLKIVQMIQYSTKVQPFPLENEENCVLQNFVSLLSSFMNKLQAAQIYVATLMGALNCKYSYLRLKPATPLSSLHLIVSYVIIIHICQLAIKWDLFVEKKILFTQLNTSRFPLLAHELRHAFMFGKVNPPANPYLQDGGGSKHAMTAVEYSFN